MNDQTNAAQNTIPVPRLLLSRDNILVAVLLAFTVLLGAYFRFTGNNWDDFVHFHPDERYLTGVGIALGGPLSGCSDSGSACIERIQRLERCRARYPETGGRGSFFDSDCSPYNPENVTLSNYSYGTLPLFMARITAEWVVDLTGDAEWLGYNGFHLAWRALNAAVDTLVILLVFLIGVHLRDKWAGLVAAMLYAGAVLPIQLSHFGTTDIITNLFVTLAIFFALRTQQTGKYWHYAAFGVALGAAVSSRVNVAPLAGVIVVVAMLRALPAFDRDLAWNERIRAWNRNFAGLVLAGGVSLIAFRLFNPYTFSGPSLFGIIPYGRFLDTLASSREMVSGRIDWAPNWQWVNRTPYLFAFQNIVLWGMGAAVGITAWVAWAFAGWRMVRGKPDATRNIAPFVWILGYFSFTGGLWVMSMRYYLPLYPSLILLAAWGLVALARRATLPDAALWRKVLAPAALTGIVGFTLLWGAMFTNIYRHMATFTQASHWVWENLPGDFYMRLEGAGDDVPLINIPLWNTMVPNSIPVEDIFFAQASRLYSRMPVSVRFVAPADGRILAVHSPHIGDPLDTGEALTLRVTVTQTDNITPLATAELRDTFPRDTHFLGQSYTLPFDTPLVVEFGQAYLFTVELVEGTQLLTAGTMILNEPWDEGMPAKVCTLPPGVTLADDPPPGLLRSDECNGRSALEGLLNSQTLDLHWEDEPNKRDRMQVMLDQTDTIIIGTNRRYDSQSRNPDRWPMTNRYYEALFSGELGFDLIATFQETFELDTLHISDQHLPTYDSPQWLNEFEPEEAFHVYDHPVVFIFQKNTQYSPANTRAILHSVSLNRATAFRGGYNDPTILGVITDSSLDVDSSPTHLQFTRDMQEFQTQGTWSERFNSDGFVNHNQILTLMIWWLTILILGFVTWPLLFVAFPALADRGYGFSKIVGMILLAWGAWVLSTLRIPVWSQRGLFVGLLILAVLSAVVAWRSRVKMRAYLLLRWEFLVWIEVITFALFLALIGIRLTNPDLWHQSFGGEKPMDFAYFNGVLRSTIFPAIDPWYSGGYLNYYYFGYVIVGVPTLLLGVVPSVAYNLILPTLFAITGIGAFSIAFSVVHGWRARVVEDTTPEPLQDMPRPRRRTMGNPWVAGMMALFLAVVAGNLDTAQVFGTAVAKMGGYVQPTSLHDFLIEDYVSENGFPPPDSVLIDLFDRAESSRLNDRIRYEVHKITSFVGGFVKGIGQVLTGKGIYVSPERWFWGPTRVISEIPNQSDGAINEMPFFTFLYADLHAHMISMSMMLFAMAFVYNELMVAGRDRRGRGAIAWALCLGALTVGLFYPTNSWDYPTFLILGAAGLGFAWWLAWRRVTRWSVLNLALRLGGFFVIGRLAMLPFTWWFAAGIDTFKVWDGKKTPLWAYLDIHGLFVFLISSLLLWETMRWLRATRVAALRGKARFFMLGLGVPVLVSLVMLAMALKGYQAALIVVPLVAWIAILFFRPEQSRPMRFILALAGLGLAITLGTEIVTLANDNGRQNTIFKFYIQAWLLFSVVGGVAFAWLVRDSLQWRARVASVWYAVVVMLLFIAALYPLMATRGKAEFRFTHDVPLTLDGMDYMLYASHWEDGLTEKIALSDEYHMIRWLQEHIEGSPVVIEAISGRVLYQWGARVANHTGLPSVIGWDYHTRQRRATHPLPLLVGQRIANVNAFYTTRDVEAAINILRHYNVGLVIFGVYEQSRYADAGGLDKFDWLERQGILTAIYREGKATVFRVNQDVLYGVWAATLPVVTE